METETLSSYKSSANMQLLEETADSTILNNGNGIHDQNLCDISVDHDKDQNSETVRTNKNEEFNMNKSTSSDQKQDMYDSDVEEEEEHVPLNIETTSDIENDELDESIEPTGNYESDKDDNELDSSSTDPLKMDKATNAELEDSGKIVPLAEKMRLTQNDSGTAIINSQMSSENQKTELKSANIEVNLDDDKNSMTKNLPTESEDTSEVINSSQIESDQPEPDEKDGPNSTCQTYTNLQESTSTLNKNKDSIEESKSEIHDKHNINNTCKTQLNNDTNASEEYSPKVNQVADDNGSKNDNRKSDCPLLMETLTKKPESCKDIDEDREDDMDEALFDPSLLCPDISMEVDEDPVITSNDAPPPPRDGNKSPLLYEPIFSTFVDEMTGAEVSFNLTPEEEALRLETYGEKNPVQFTKIHCTACNVHLGSALDGQGNRFVHPLLKVLICKNCYHFYTSGEFEKDEDGSELYCRWCGQGGQVMCCSNCEMVFCKKCIRINFDRRKLTEIRDSDDWMCFRCNPSQLTIQRIHCAEFMEYIRREIGRASTLENATAFMTKDHTQCCVPPKKKTTESPAGEPKKKRRKTSTDPDYDPYKDREETDSPQPSTSGFKIIPSTQQKTVPTTKPPNIVSCLPKPTDTNKNISVPPVNTSTSNTFKIGSTIFKSRTPTVSQVRPRVQVFAPVTTNGAPRPRNSSPGYIKILPGGIRVPGNTPTPRNTNYTSRQILSVNSQPTTPTTVVNSVQNKQQPIRNAAPTHTTTPAMKHEWFEKTVRAAARVNSNLSYTLTQLNRAQANAQSVEALAVVHNKLQEILSTSINSLIQIRKNLRTEFIAGIKNIRFPPAAPKPTSAPPTPQATLKPSVQDDDVIFISPPTSPVPSPLIQQSPSVANMNSVNLPSSVSLIKKSSSVQNTNDSTPKAVTTSENNNSSDRPKTFLRVKSLTALQNVPSECITIPDDPLPTPPPLVPIKTVESVQRLSEIRDSQKEVVEIIDDKKEENRSEKESKKEENDSENEVPVSSKNEDDKVDLSSEKDDDETVTYDLKEPHSDRLISIMKGLKIVLEKSTLVEKRIQSSAEEMNGDMSD